MTYKLIESAEQLPSLLSAIAAADLIGMDTEFVAEDCYRPDLCLLQVSTRSEVFNIDPKSIPDLSAVWKLIVDGSRTVIVHAGREEILFAYRETFRTIPKLFDVQVAVGMLGGEYPASYGKLLQRVLGVNVPKGETRTDWRKRPLSKAQLDYAALDVLHLPQLYDSLREQLIAQGRDRWLDDELQRRQQQLIVSENEEGWYRLSGIQSLYGRQLGIVRELWLWRDQRARAKNMPARRVLRDDLIVELAKRGVTDERKIHQIRGLHHPGIQRLIPELATCIARGANDHTPRLPGGGQSKRIRPSALLQQFLSAAMSFLCRNNNIAPSIVGTSDDVGRLAAYWLADEELPEDHEDFPSLLKGWRADMVGKPLYNIYSGRAGLRVQDPNDEMPLSLFEIDSPT